MVQTVLNLKPSVGAFDTETTGLHIVYDKPFLYQFGFVDTTLDTIYTYVVDIQKQPTLAKQVITAWQALALKFENYLAHNVKFDVHMGANIGLPYTGDNLDDTMFYIRYGHNAVQTSKGGPPLKLKDYCARYISRSAKNFEKKLKVERGAIAKQYNLMLKQRLNACPFPQDNKYKSYTIGYIESIFKDPLATAENLPNVQAQEAYRGWVNEDLPVYLRNKVTGIITSDMIPYHVLNRDNVIEYGHLDIVWVLEVFLQLAPVVKARQNEKAIEIERKMILPLVEMERCGFDADVEYLMNCKENTKTYMLDRRSKLAEIFGEPVSVGQHALIKEKLNALGVPLESTNDETMERCKSDLIRETPDHIAIKAISLIQELRTLEKWYATYIQRFIYDLSRGHKLYTTINQVGTVSGRVTSDFQQFPKKGLRTEGGIELFHPRKLIKSPSTVYLDYSQIELRFQALYTILVGNPDTNLCRAYMPYECEYNGIKFDYNNPKHIKDWNAHPWYYCEDPVRAWVATDVHGATTKAAFNIDEKHPDYHDLRYIGKRVNFAKNYGAQYKKIRTMFPDRTDEECARIDAAYYTAFPGVKAYHQYCYNIAQMQSNVRNLFGIRYYGVSGHNLINMLVQGSAAFYLKLKIIELCEYSKQHSLKTKWQMQIHDELSWLYDPDDTPDIFFTFKKIMEDWEDGLVPIVADMEVSTTCWAEKKEVNKLEELKDALST